MRPILGCLLMPYMFKICLQGAWAKAMFLSKKKSSCHNVLLQQTWIWIYSPSMTTFGKFLSTPMWGKFWAKYFSSRISSQKHKYKCHNLQFRQIGKNNKYSFKHSRFFGFEMGMKHNLNYWMHGTSLVSPGFWESSEVFFTITKPCHTQVCYSALSLKQKCVLGSYSRDCSNHLSGKTRNGYSQCHWGASTVWGFSAPCSTKDQTGETRRHPTSCWHAAGFRDIIWVHLPGGAQLPHKSELKGD